jgi:hypothetical protein
MLLLAMARPLRAQLDPRLQGSKTDFLDMYQQSSTAKVKPELLTIFDFSSSMKSLMCHPLYQNNDLSDADDMRYMTFALQAAGGGSNQTYTIYATGNNCACQVSYTLTVTSGGVTGNASGAGSDTCGGTGASGAPPSYTFKAAATGNTAAYDTVLVQPVSSANSAASNGTKYTVALGTNTGQKAGSGQQNPYTIQNITWSPSASQYAPGTVVTFTATLDHNLIEGESSSDDGITWSGGISSGTLSSSGSGVYTMTGTFTIPNYTYVAGTAGTTSTLNPITCTGSLATGQTLTFATSYSAVGTNTAIKWSMSPTSNNCGATYPYLNGQASNSTVTDSGSSSSVTFTVPPCTSTSASSNPWVKVTLDASKGLNYSVSGLTYANSAGSPMTAGSNSNTPTTGLVRPDGSMLTINNFQNYSGSLTVNGFSKGSADVRNWIRQASHVRFKSGSRTIDIPIPWNIGTNGALANPVTDQTVTDLETTVTPNVGSGGQIPMDTCYQVDDSKSSVSSYQTGGVFTTTGGGAIASGSTATSVMLASVAYRPSYVSWLFNGKFSSTAGTPNYTSDSALQGKYIIFDAASTTGVYGQSNVSWGKAFGPSSTPWGSGYNVPQYDQGGNYLSETSSDPSVNAIPALTRAQAVKRAAIQTWIAHQADVVWAYRFLDPYSEANQGGASTIDNNSQNYLINTGSPVHTIGNDSDWTVLNSNSTGNMARIASMFPNGATPLTYAMARGLAQFTDPTSVFNSVESGSVSQCQNSFLILFTDGIDNNGQPVDADVNTNYTTPYLDSNGNFSALAGNQAIIAAPTSIDTTGAYWNLYTFAAIGAHMADANLGTTPGTNYLAGLNPGSSPTSGVPHTFLPYAITQRAGTSFANTHRVTTMTVGVSLGGLVTNSQSPKYSLFTAALLGDPGTGSGTISGSHAFVPPVFSGSVVTQENDWVPKPSDPTSYPTIGQKATGAVYYFDATNPTLLSQCLNVALLAVISTSSNNATATPNLPYVGASLASQVYLGSFQIPKTGGPVWSGDLEMFDTKTVQTTNASTGAVSATVEILDQSGNVAGTVGQSTAQWSASTIIENRNWSLRKLFTRLPWTSVSNAEPGLSSFTDTGTAFTDATVGLNNFVATDLGTGTTGVQQRQQVIENAAGANVVGVALGTRPATSGTAANRLNMMGDVIDSGPAYLEYNLQNATVVSGLAAHGLSLSNANHFRIVLVGDNEGWLHAFGELSSTNATGSAVPVSAVADELWTFMPTDFLANLDAVYGPSAASNPHRFMVDGTPSIYFLDLPGAGGTAPNGVLDYNASSQERAIAIVGLGKGGRSYYALDIRDPFNPVLLWTLRPDEWGQGVWNTARNRTSPAMSNTNLQNLVANMGFSTCTPGIGRVLFQGVAYDVVFLGGGLITPELEPNFKVSGVTPEMGRSVLAIDVATGNILSAYQFSGSQDQGSSTVAPGPVVAGVVPFEFIRGSGMSQRAYFTDRLGGLWAWGSKQVNPSTSSSYPNFRVDSSDLAQWTVDGNIGSAAGIRKVAQDGNTNGAIYTTLPAPFVVGSFPGVAQDGKTSVAAVGVAMVSGDRYDPTDDPTTYPGYTTWPGLTRPDHFRLTVAFDRQDSRAWSLDSASSPDTGIQDSNLYNFTNEIISSNPAGSACGDALWQYITPGCSNYYLAPSSGTPDFGYYVNFPSISGNGFIDKGISSPIVVSGSLFYSYFAPSSYDPCSGGSGTTYTGLIASALNPIVKDERTGLAVLSGIIYSWNGLASGLQAYGSQGVIQGGAGTTSNGSGGSNTSLLMQTFQASSAQQHPKVRVWRPVTAVQ